MSTQTQPGPKDEVVKLSDDDLAFLLSVLRDPGRTFPLTTQQLIDALRSWSSR